MYKEVELKTVKQRFNRDDCSPGFLEIYDHWIATSPNQYERKNGITYLFHVAILDEEDIKGVMTYPTNHEPGIVLFIRMDKTRDKWYFMVPTDTQLKGLWYVILHLMPIIERYSIERMEK